MSSDNEPVSPKKTVDLAALKALVSKIPPRVFWQGKFAPAFWTVASVLSLTVNLILILILLVLGRQLFALKALIQDGLIGGLYNNFVLMDQANIQTTIEVNDTIQVVDNIQVVFDLPLKQDTVVILVEDTSIPNAQVLLNGFYIPTTVILPQGTPLNISLDLVVPVNTTVPVVLNVPVALKVPVDIPLDQTELHTPFVGLKDVVSPYQELLSSLPDGWDETPLCGPLTGWLCRWVFGVK
jgi:hypothetical protein